MGYLSEKRKQAQIMLNTFNYELSNEVVARKLEWQKQIAEMIENDEYNGVLNIEDEYISVETEGYDKSYDDYFYTEKDVIEVGSYNGEVYVVDYDGNEYYLDDIKESTMKSIYESVVELINEEED